MKPRLRGARALGPGRTDFVPGGALKCLLALGLVAWTWLAASPSMAATLKVNFILNTTNADGAPVAESRYYYVYRPDGLSLSTPVPMILIMEGAPNSGAQTLLNTKAGQVGFVVVSCSFSGNSTGTPGTVWNNDNPRITGWEDFDYTTEVINRVRASDNCNDAFIMGLSKGGHMSLAYACERPSMIKAAGPMDEFMGLTSNLPSAPVPMILFQGTADSNVPYTMMKDTVDAWLTMDGLLNSVPVTTCEASPLIPGKVTQTTWRGGVAGMQVAFVTLVGGTHTYPTPTVQTGYNVADGAWSFFSQYLTSLQAAPRIVSSPVNNVQASGQPASFWVSATGNAPLSYQWQKNATNIPGATSNWYTTPPAAVADSGATFRAVVQNSSGSVTSALATLTVTAAPADPVITIQPADRVVKAGQPVSFSVTASGTAPLSYQWLKNGVNLVGATSATLTIPSAIAPDHGATFRVLVSNTAGSLTSTAGTLSVLPAAGAPLIITNPSRARVLVGQTGSFSVAAWSPTPIGYQWQKGVFTGNMTNIPGANAATYVTPPTTLSDHLTLFRCIMTTAAGNATSASEMLFVTTATARPTDITSLITAYAQVNLPFAYTIVSSGGTAPILYHATPLPHGLTVDPNTGVISGIPTALGTTVVSLVASNSAGSTLANLKLIVVDTTPAVSIEDWRSAHFGASAYNQALAGNLADPDLDGFVNLWEYATGTDPLKADRPAWTCAIEDGFLTLSMARNAAAAGLTWEAETSADLRVWARGGGTVLQSSNNLFKVRDNVCATTNARHFLRLNVAY